MGILLVYSVVDAVSFKNIFEWLKSIEKNAVAEVTKILIGNKCDLEDQRVWICSQLCFLLFTLSSSSSSPDGLRGARESPREEPWL